MEALQHRGTSQIYFLYSAVARPKTKKTSKKTKTRQTEIKKTGPSAWVCAECSLRAVTLQAMRVTALKSPEEKGKASFYQIPSESQLLQIHLP